MNQYMENNFRPSEVMLAAVAATGLDVSKMTDAQIFVAFTSCC